MSIFARLVFIRDRFIILGCQSHSINSHLTPKSFVIDFDVINVGDDDDDDDDDVVRFFGIGRRCHLR